MLNESRDPDELEACGEAGSTNAVSYNFLYEGDISGGTLNRTLSVPDQGGSIEDQFEIPASFDPERGGLNHFFCYTPKLDIQEVRIAVSVSARDGKTSNTLSGLIETQAPRPPRLSNPLALYPTNSDYPAAIDFCSDFGFPGQIVFVADYDGRLDLVGAILHLNYSAQGETVENLFTLDENAYSSDLGVVAVVNCINIRRFAFDVRVAVWLQFRDGDRSNTVTATLRR